MKFRARSPFGYRYAPMIVEGGAVKVMVYDRRDLLVGVLEVRAAAMAGNYLVCGEDPARGKRVRTRVEGISAFDAAGKYCTGSLP